MKRANREIVIRGRAEIAKLEKFVEEICDYCNVNNEYFGNILLATTEAAGILLSINEAEGRNALEIRFDHGSKGLVFHIRLAGTTESTEDQEDILEREIRRHKLSRDIFIVKALADEITISVNAKNIVLVFYVSSMNYEKSLLRINELKEYWKRNQVAIPKK